MKQTKKGFNLTLHQAIVPKIKEYIKEIDYQIENNVTPEKVPSIPKKKFKTFYAKNVEVKDFAMAKAKELDAEFENEFFKK